MKVVCGMLAGVVVCAMTVAVAADEKKSDNAQLVVGTWECAKSGKAKVPVGAVLEVGKDGKYKLSYDEKGSKVTDEGTYKVDGDKVVFGDKNKDTVTIKKLSETELVVVNQDGDTIEWKRKKGS